MFLEMNIIPSMTFPELLEQKFLAWQSEQGKRKTLDEFAEYLGVSRPIISHWLAGKRSPSPESIQTLSSKLGPEIYDVLGLERPDPDLVFIAQQWDNLDPATRRHLREQAEKFASKNDTQRTSPKRRTRTAE
jgi:transcriptional regulator with XRE-family HTH domain